MDMTVRNLSKVWLNGSPVRGLVFPLLAAVLLSGCAHRYDIILTNGGKVTNVTKPVLDRGIGVFTYKDVAGNEHEISAGRVVDIGPHSKKNDPPDTGK
jgi:hypothetical protein